MKTPAEWNLIFMTTQTPTFDLISQVQSDARAGMVPEGDLGQMRTRAEMWERNAMRSEAELADARASYDASHAANTKLHDALVAAKAELAKAWEAGRDAAADHLKWCRDEECCNPQLVRALQPPGGKAK